MSILVRHAMTESPQTITPDMNASDAAGMMRSEDVGVLPVVDGGRLVGLVTDRDLVLRVLADRKNPMEVRELMEEHKVRRLPVMKGAELVGILSIGDVAWADASTREVGETLRAVSESEETRGLSEDAARGTPDRVMENRE
jgi:CBS domain-containing protein